MDKYNMAMERRDRINDLVTAINEEILEGIGTEGSVFKITTSQEMDDLGNGYRSLCIDASISLEPWHTGELSSDEEVAA